VSADATPPAKGGAVPPRIAALLKSSLIQVRRLRAERDALVAQQTEPIAIVGIGCRFPGGSDSPDAFWDLLSTSRDGVVDLDDRWDLVGARPMEGTPRWAGLVDNIDGFDPAVFGIAPREAVSLDPQHRLLLEVGWEALEDAQIPVNSLQGSKTGVFVGACFTDYLDAVTAQAPAHKDVYGSTGNMLSVAGGRLAYTFGFSGPCISIDTACSSSLVAIHLGVKSLRDRESDTALCGGVNAVLSPHTMEAGYRLQALSPVGRCKTFDASADGFVRGEGAGIVVLKRLSDAQRDGDRIWGVVRGTAINQDGRSSGLTAPNVAAQEAVLRDAIAAAGLEATDIDLVECHGTGTPLGDPIEVDALRAVVGQPRTDGSTCVLGAVKSNVGHLEGAAGVAGLVKVLLSMREELIPKNLHYRTLNPRISVEGSALTLGSKDVPWPQGDRVRRAGISGFGLSGTNAHIIVEEPPVAGAADDAGDEAAAAPIKTASKTPTAAADGAHLFVLSAKSEGALDEAAHRLAAQLDAQLEAQTGGDDAPHLGDLARSLALGRSHHEHRLAITATRQADLHTALTAQGTDALAVGVSRASSRLGRAPKVVFVFPGQGSQWVGMGRRLLDTEPAFREALTACDAAIQAESGWSLLDVLRSDDPEGGLSRIDVIQPALFSMEVAYAALWRSVGVEPDAVVGHSMGETAAAHVAGSLTLKDAVAVICRRSKLLTQVVGKGVMALVELSVDEAQAALVGFEDRLSVAVSNSPRSTVLSGDPAALDEVLAALEARDVFCRRVKVDVASHSPQVDPLRPQLLTVLADLQPQTGTVPMHSTVRGVVVPGTELTPEYWADNLRQPVRFGHIVANLIDDAHTVFIEMTPHPLLVPAVLEALKNADVDGQATGSGRRNQDDQTIFLESVGSLYASGFPLDHTKLHPEAGPRVDLPTYAFQRDRYWVAKPAEGPSMFSGGGAAGHPLVGELHPVSVLSSGAHLFRAFMNVDQLPWLADHVVQGAIVLPGAAYLEMALHAGAQVMDCEPIVSDVVIGQALALPPDSSLEVQVALTPRGQGTMHWQIASSPPGRGIWRVHVQGMLRRPSDAPAGTMDVAGIQARLGTPETAEQTYEKFHAMGLMLGPALQGLRELRHGDGEALGQIVLPDVAGSDEGYRLHPALLDACFQVILGAVEPDQKTPSVPVGFGSLTYFGRPDGPLWCHGRVETKEEDAEGKRRIAFTVANAEGEIIFEIGEMTVKRLAATGAAEAQEGDDWFLGLDFQPVALPEMGPEESANEQSDDGRWLVMGSADDLGPALTASLREAGDAVVFVGTPGDDSAAGMTTLLKREFGTEPPTGVVHLRSLDSEANIESGLRHGTDSVLHTIQAISGMEWRDAPRLWLVTRGAQTGESPFQAPILGFSRVAALEHGELRCTRVDLDGAGFDPIAPLTQELLAGDEEEELRLGHDGRLVGRLLQRLPEDGPREVQAPANGRAFQLQLDAPGVLDRTRIRAIERTDPGPGEVEIAVTASGLNFLDVMKAMGLVPDDIEGASTLTLGGECAGTVSALGEGVTGLTVGQSVVALGRGTLASHVVTPAALVLARPDSLKDTEAAALPVAWITAYYALSEIARLKSGERVLIHAASGGVGHAAIQWAQHVGAEIYATAGSPEKRAYLASLGVQHVSDSRSDAFVADVMKWTDGEGVDVVLNSLSGDLLRKGFDVLRDHGRFVELGKRDAYEDGNIGLRPFLRSLSLSLVDLRSMILDRPEQVRDLFKTVLGLVVEGVFSPPRITAQPLARVTGALQTMAQGQHIGKLVLSVGPDISVWAPKEATALVRPDASYIVTGGLGGLGLSVAGWLVEQGATHLVLVGRSGAGTPEKRASVAALEAQGAKITVLAEDVGDATACARVVAAAPNLRGVIQAAGTLDDGVILQQTPARFRTVMGPKAGGAWNLHTLTLDHDLDLFVMYGSAAGLLGSPGQSNHAAANTFLDSLAHHRRRLGLPAVTIDWGAFSEVGAAAAKEDRGERLAARGTKSLTPAQGLDALERVLAGNQAQVGVVPLDVRQWVEFYPAAASSRLLSNLVSAQAQSGPRTAGDTELMAQISRGTPVERAGLLEGFLADQVSFVLRVPLDKLDKNEPLTTMGMDSLMGLELRNRIEAALGITVSATLLWTYPTVEALAAHLVGLLEPGDGDAAAPDEAEVRRQQAAEEAAEQEAEALDEFRALDEEQQQSAFEDRLAALSMLVDDEEDDF
jgi:acyl transferase domain-containing protein/NADPH:quinone reductase-like Zn-dependent oxidoreductase/NAD(P)-dependent dehydrogenase (short-subunit alcohol dehydrogenase family)/acyl carrier protein